jgi:hypothetical protein
MYHDIKERLERDPEFLSNTITGDETWVYRYDTYLMMSPRFKRNRRKHLTSFKQSTKYGWYNHWTCCIKSQADYFEGESIE